MQLGQTACIRGRVALCGRVLNNTSWAISKTPCPLAMSLPVGPRLLQ